MDVEDAGAEERLLGRSGGSCCGLEDGEGDGAAGAGDGAFGVGEGGVVEDAGAGGRGHGVHEVALLGDVGEGGGEEGCREGGWEEGLDFCVVWGAGHCIFVRHGVLG